MKVICPTDFSLNAYHAMHYAALLAHKTGNNLILIHAISSSVSSPILKGVRADETNMKIEDAGNKLKQFIEEIRDRFPSIKVSYFVSEDKIIDSIKKKSDEDSDSIVVMGTLGATGMKKKLFGSNTISVIKHTSLPVLVVPANTPLRSPDKIVVATDYYLSDLGAINYIVSIATKLNSEIKIIHVIDGNKSEQEEKMLLNDFSAWIMKSTNYPNLHCSLFRNSNISEGIINFTNSVKGDLISITTHKKGFLNKMFEKNIAEDVIKQLKVPVIVFPENYE